MKQQPMHKTEGALPCPFCGSTEVWSEHYEHHEGAYRWRVLCAECMGQVDTGTWQNEGYAVEAWNKRS